jgi:hypothetical protein
MTLTVTRSVVMLINVRLMPTMTLMATKFAGMRTLVYLMPIMIKIVTGFALSVNAETIRNLLANMANAVITCLDAKITNSVLLTTSAPYVDARARTNAEEINVHWMQRTTQIVTDCARMSTNVTMTQKTMPMAIPFAVIKTLVNTMS